MVERPTQAVIPANLLAWAKQRGVVDPEFQWRRFLDANGGDPPPNCDARFIKWLATAPTKKPEKAPPLEAPREPSPPAKQWEAPSHWDEARQFNEKHPEYGTRAAENILAALDKIPRDADAPRPRQSTNATTDAPQDPQNDSTGKEAPKT